MLAAVAVPARQTQVFQHVAACGVNVVDLHRLPAIVFTGLAVFAAATGAFINVLLEGIPR